MTKYISPAFAAIMLLSVPITSPVTTTDGIYQLSEASHIWDGTVIANGLVIS